MAENNKANKQIKSSNKIISYSSMKLLTHRLMPNSKNPGTEWNKANRGMCQLRRLDELSNDQISKKQNYGVFTGKSNSIVVVDLDFYKGANAKWVETFGDDYVKDIDTFSVRTGRGGFHLYFTYDPQIKATQSAEFSIDIKNDGGYVVGPYSKIIKDGTTMEYTIINQADIKPCPEHLKEWLLNNLYKTKPKKARNPKVKVVNPITNEEVEDDEDEIDLGVYKFAIPEKVVEKYICKGLPDRFFNEYEEYLKFTTGMKTLGMKKLWKKYPKLNNPVDGDVKSKGHKLWMKTMWDNIHDHNKLFVINHLFNESKCKGGKNILSYYKYKPTDCHNEKPDVIINQHYLKHDEIDIHLATAAEEEHQCKCLVIRSDTGTGKTTAMKHYLKKHDDRFISTVSRISLGKEQTVVFQKQGLDCDYWETIQAQIDGENEANGPDCHWDQLASWSDYEGDNVIITIDSLMKMSFYDFDGYTIFLDEFNSLIEYFVTCHNGNLIKNRIGIQHKLNRILREAKLIVCTDADISDTSLLYLKQQNINYKFIDNTYKHNSGIKADELKTFDEYKKQLLREDKFLMACDSKTMAQALGVATGAKVYTSEHVGHIDLDADEKVIFSPKVVYGLDSLMERPVYGYFTGKTITPKAMNQQINRCRNITHLYYHFEIGGVLPYKYHNYQEIIDEMTYHNKYGQQLFGQIAPELNKQYLELSAQFEYNMDCYNTNKKAHFINILENKGFDVSYNYISEEEDPKQKLQLMEKSEQIKMKDMIILCDTFYFDNCVDEFENQVKPGLKYETYKLSAIAHFPEWICRINEILKVEWDQIHNYYTHFTKQHVLAQHFAWTDFFKKSIEDIKGNLEYRRDFPINKVKTAKQRCLFLNKFEEKIFGVKDGSRKISFDIIDPETITSVNGKDFPFTDETEQIRKWEKEYRTIFRFRGKDFPDLKDKKECLKLWVKINTQIFGDSSITTTKTTKDKKTIYKYQYNKGFYVTNYGLSEKRKDDNDS